MNFIDHWKIQFWSFKLYWWDRHEMVGVLIHSGLIEYKWLRTQKMNSMKEVIYMEIGC